MVGREDCVFVLYDRSFTRSVMHNNVFASPTPHQNTGKTTEQAEIVRWFLTMTTPRQMFWLTQIVLKSLKINLSETTLFRAWHEDAPELYNKCGASLRKVFNTMTDTSKRFSTVGVVV